MQKWVWLSFCPWRAPWGFHSVRRGVSALQSRNWSVVCGHGPPALSVGQGGFHWRLHFELGALVGPGAGWRVLQERILKDCGVLVTETVPFSDGRCLVLKDNGKVDYPCSQTCCQPHPYLRTHRHLEPPLSQPLFPIVTKQWATLGGRAGVPGIPLQLSQLRLL